MATSIDDILANLFAAIENDDYGIQGKGQGYDVKLYGVPELKELQESLGLIAPESSIYTLADVHAAVAGFHYNSSSNFATLQSDILTTIETLIVENSPVIDGGDTAAFTIDENTIDVATIAASDAQGDMLDYTLSGVDAFLFQIDDDGNLSFIDAPDFETPSDVGDDNTYDVTVTVSDGAQTDSQEIAVTVADVDEATPGVTVDYGDVFGANYTGTPPVVGSSGDDTISFGFGTAFIFGEAIINGLDGNDTISFGEYAAFEGGKLSVDGGAGSDTISFGDAAGFASAYAGGYLTIDLGFEDGAADELIFTGTVYDASVNNWIAGEDALVDVVDPSDWTGVDNGADTEFTTANYQSITFVGVTGLGTDVDDFLF